MIAASLARVADRYIAEEWSVEYGDDLDVELTIGGAVYHDSIGLQGGVIEIEHEGQPLTLTGERDVDDLFLGAISIKECSDELITADPVGRRHQRRPRARSARDRRHDQVHDELRGEQELVCIAPAD